MSLGFFCQKNQLKFSHVLASSAQNTYTRTHMSIAESVTLSRQLHGRGERVLSPIFFNCSSRNQTTFSRVFTDRCHQQWILYSSKITESFLHSCGRKTCHKHTMVCEKCRRYGTWMESEDWRYKYLNLFFLQPMYSTIFTHQNRFSSKNTRADTHVSSLLLFSKVYIYAAMDLE
jgi:hypothetical protein